MWACVESADEKKRLAAGEHHSPRQEVTWALIALQSALSARDLQFVDSARLLAKALR